MGGRVLQTTFRCTLLQDSEETICPRDGVCIKGKDVCQWLRMSARNQPGLPKRVHSGKIFIPPSGTQVTNTGDAGTSTTIKGADNP